MNTAIAGPIMIVEDDPSIMNNMVEIFQLLGRKVIMAQNGFIGIEKLKHMPPHHYPRCIILDLMMPQMDGEQFIYQIQALGKVELDCIPIVVSSAAPRLQRLDSERIRIKLRKPIDFRDLEEISQTYQ